MASRIDRAALRRQAMARTLFAPRGLLEAVEMLGFVQIDPLRAPARAQDLILRHRVDGYRAGDLGRAYAQLPLIEDFVHVQGVLPAGTRRLLHPRVIDRTWHVEDEHPRLAAALLAHLRRHGPTHPRDLARTFGRAAVVNGWGGQSSATSRMLEVMHYRGQVHVVRRDDGLKVYGVAPPARRALAPATRMTGLLRLLLRLYAPLPVATLRELARMAGDAAFDNAGRERLVSRFIARDDVERVDVDKITYLSPADAIEPQAVDEARVRFLAPFDPLVWDRRRFAHLHGWDYRFEAYTPAARRRYGYYALPLAWRDRVIGWVNVRRAGEGLDVTRGFADRAPAGRAFARAFDHEVDRVAAFLAPGVPAATP
jgi:uncharacterized protein YcaQ